MSAVIESIAGPAACGHAATASKRFVAALLAGVVLPLPVIALLTLPLAAEPAAIKAFDILFLMSVAHGGLSGIFWIDRRYRRHMGSHPRTYYLDVAMIAVLGVTGAIVIGSGFFGVFTIIFTVWTVVHFARQNWGVLCLTGLANGTGRPGRLAARACVLGCAGGALGLLPGWVMEILPDGIRTVGLVLALAGAAAGLVEAGRQYARGQPCSGAMMTAAIGVFFMPAYLLGRDTGFVAIGIGHAIQYAVITGIVAADRKQGTPWLRICGTLISAGIYISLFLFFNDAHFWGDWIQPAQVLLNCVVMWHFIVDAGLWRMSQAFQRQAVSESFPFLFAARTR